MRSAAGVALATLLLFPTSAGATYRPQERIPTNHPVYRELERLAESYGAMPYGFFSRPLRLQEAVAFLAATELTYPEAAYDPAMVRARRALDAAYPEAKGPFIKGSGDQDEALTISLYASARYDDDPRNLPDLNRDYRIGAQAVASLDSSTVFVLDAYAGRASQGGRGTPNFGTLNALIEGADLNSWIEEGYLETRLSKIHALVGHSWLRWGPGREGTLALSDAGPALDMIRGETGFTNRWRLSWFVSILDPGPQTYLAGHRLEWALGDGMRIGLNELGRFDGTSQALLYLIPIVPYSFWEKRPKTVPPGAVPGDTTGLAFTKNNVLWSLDLAWVTRRGFRIWGEMMIDDISFSRDYKPDMIGWQLGAEERWHIGSSGELDDINYHMLTASIEYSRVNNYVYSVWHGHDFSSRGFPVGFVHGPDVVHYSAEVDYEHSASIEVRLRGEVRKKGEGALGDPWIPAQGEVDAGSLEGVVERDARVSLTGIFWPGRMLRLEATVGHAWIKNHRHADVGEETDVPFRLAGRFEF